MFILPMNYFAALAKIFELFKPFLQRSSCSNIAPGLCILVRECLGNETMAKEDESLLMFSLIYYDSLITNVRPGLATGKLIFQPE